MFALVSSKNIFDKWRFKTHTKCYVNSCLFFMWVTCIGLGSPKGFSPTIIKVTQRPLTFDVKSRKSGLTSSFIQFLIFSKLSFLNSMHTINTKFKATIPRAMHRKEKLALFILVYKILHGKKRNKYFFRKIFKTSEWPSKNHAAILLVSLFVMNNNIAWQNQKRGNANVLMGNLIYLAKVQNKIGNV